LDEGWETFNEDLLLRLPYGSHARQVETALDKLFSCRSELLHGPLVRYGLNSPKLPAMESAAKTQDTTVALLYASAYGNTATLRSDARGITKAGVGGNRLTAKLRSQLRFKQP